MTVIHLGGPNFPICGEKRFHSWRVTTVPAEVTCKRCLASADYRMVSERRRRQIAEGTP